MTEAEIERSQHRYERLFPIHWLMEGSTMRTRVNNMLVSTVHMPNCPIRGDHYETMVFKCDYSGIVTSWHDLFCLFTHDEVVGHENGIAWAQAATAKLPQSHS